MNMRIYHFKYGGNPRDIRSYDAEHCEDGYYIEGWPEKIYLTRENPIYIGKNTYKDLRLCYSLIDVDDPKNYITFFDVHGKLLLKSIILMRYMSNRNECERVRYIGRREIESIPINKEGIPISIGASKLMFFRIGDISTGFKVDMGQLNIAIDAIKRDMCELDAAMELCNSAIQSSRSVN